MSDSAERKLTAAEFLNREGIDLASIQRTIIPKVIDAYVEYLASSERREPPSAAPTDDAFESAWKEYNANGNAGGWERVAFISGFGKGFRAALKASEAAKSAAVGPEPNESELAKEWLDMPEHDIGFEAHKSTDCGPTKILIDSACERCAVEVALAAYATYRLAAVGPEPAKE